MHMKPAVEHFSWAEKIEAKIKPDIFIIALDCYDEDVKISFISMDSLSVLVSMMEWTQTNQTYSFLLFLPWKGYYGNDEMMLLKNYVKISGLVLQ